MKQTELKTRFTIEGGDVYEITALDDMQKQPNLRASIMTRGMDGCMYVAERVLTGRQRAKRVMFFYRHAGSGRLVSMLGNSQSNETFEFGYMGVGRVEVAR
jgi:hypothetical protein